MKRKSTKHRQLHECEACGKSAGQSCQIDGVTHHYCDACYLPIFTQLRAEYQQQRSAWRNANIKRGAAYWEARGIDVGALVKATVVDLLTGGLLGSETYTGVASVGARGAYVHVDGDSKQYDPNCFQPAPEHSAAGKQTRITTFQA